MKKEHISFAIAGVIFGTLLGFVLAHELYGGRHIGVPAATSPVAAGPRGGMPPQGAGSGMGAPMDSSAAPSDGAGTQTMEQVSKEIESLKAAIGKNPRDAESLARLGGLYMDAGMYDRALEFVHSALELKPEDIHVQIDYATCLLMTGKAADALAQLENAVARDASHPRAWYFMGLAQVDVGEYDKGEASFKRALELSPGSFDLDALRAEIEKVKAQRASGASGASPS